MQNPNTAQLLKVRSASVWKRIGLLLLALVSNTLPAVEFYKGDEVTVREHAALFFEDKIVRRGTHSEHFIVIESRPQEGKVFFLSTDESGQSIALNALSGAVVLVREGFLIPNANAFSYAGTYFANPQLESIHNGMAAITNRLTPGGTSLVANVPVNYVPSGLVARYEMIHENPESTPSPSSNPGSQKTVPSTPAPSKRIPPTESSGPDSSAPLTILDPLGENYEVTLVDATTGQEKMSVHVSGNVTVQVPLGSYHMNVMRMGPNLSYLPISTKVYKFEKVGWHVKGYKIKLGVP